MVTRGTARRLKEEGKKHKSKQKHTRTAQQQQQQQPKITPLPASANNDDDTAVLHLKGAREQPSALLKLQAVVRSGDGNSDCPVTPMIDSGASGMGFVDPAFARRCGATLQPSKRRIVLADGSEVDAQGQVALQYSIAGKTGGAVRFTSTFTVTPLDAYEMILGVGWLKQHHVLVAFHENSMQLRVDGAGERRAIRVVQRMQDDGIAALAPLRLTALSERGFARSLRKGDVLSLRAVFVRDKNQEDLGQQRGVGVRGRCRGIVLLVSDEHCAQRYHVSFAQ